MKYLPLYSATLVAGALMVSPACDKAEVAPLPNTTFSPAEVSADLGYGQAAYEYTANIVGFGPRPPASGGMAKVRAYVRQQLEAAGWTTRNQSFEANLPAEAAQAVGRSKMALTNVIARHGDSPKDARFILCAHIDSKRMPGTTFVGADDAASAVASIIVIAKELAQKNPELANQLEIVFFDGEEALVGDMGPKRNGFDGVYGSRFYAESWRNRNKPQAALLLDMIGHKDLDLIIPGNCPPDLVQRLLESATAEGGGDFVQPRRDEILDDHVPLNLAKIPCVNLLGNFADKDWWHSTGAVTDDLSIIDPDSLDFSIRTALRFLRDSAAQ